MEGLWRVFKPSTGAMWRVNGLDSTNRSHIFKQVPSTHAHPMQAETYEAVKARFETKVMEVATHPARKRFLVLSGRDMEDLNNQHQFLSRALLQLHSGGLTFVDEDETRKPFLPRWLLDAGRRQIDYVLNEPKHEPVPDRVHNLWSPPRASLLPPVTDTDALLAPIQRHVREVLAGGNVILADFVLDFLCNAIQRPHQPAGVALLVGGPSGCGKGILFEFLRRGVLGHRTTLSTASPLWHLLLPAQKVQDHYYALAQVDESFHKHIRAFAKLLQARHQRIAALVCTSSHLGDASVPAAYSNLFVTLRCRMPTDAQAYFAELGPHLRRDDVARAFYQYAMARDLSQYEPNFQRHTPAYLAEVEERERMPRFLSALANAAPTQPIAAGTLRALYMACTGDFCITATSFGNQLHHSWRHLVRKHRTRTGIAYSVDDAEALRDMLIYYGVYDADAVLCLGDSHA